MQRYRLIMNIANYDCYLFRKRLRFSELEATCQKSKGFYQYSSTNRLDIINKNNHY